MAYAPLEYGYKASKGFPKFPDTLLIAELAWSSQKFLPKLHHQTEQ
jgi:hypothetical protein